MSDVREDKLEVNFLKDLQRADHRLERMEEVHQKHMPQQHLKVKSYLDSPEKNHEDGKD